MQYTISKSGSGSTVSITGRLTFNEQADFRTMLKELAAIADSNLTLDISRAEFIDSAGLGLLLRANTLLTDGGKSLKLKAPTEGQVRDILEISQFHQLIPFL